MNSFHSRLADAVKPEILRTYLTVKLPAYERATSARHPTLGWSRSFGKAFALQCDRGDDEKTIMWASAIFARQMEGIARVARKVKIL
jgi:hypothetical protein